MRTSEFKKLLKEHGAISSVMEVATTGGILP